MSSPLIHFNQRVIADGSMGGNLSTSSIEVSEVALGSVHAIWSAGSTPVGDLIVSGSNDNSTFTTISTDAVSGNSGSLLKRLGSIDFAYLKVSYTRTSGSGTLNVYVCGKN